MVQHFLFDKVVADSSICHNDRRKAFVEAYDKHSQASDFSVYLDVCVCEMAVAYRLNIVDY